MLGGYRPCMTQNFSRYPGAYLIKCLRLGRSPSGYKLNLEYTLHRSDVDSLLCCVWSANEGI